MKLQSFIYIAMFISAAAMAQEQESDFAQPAQSENVVEEYGPAPSALVEQPENVDGEMNDSIADANNDFSRTVPEPRVAKQTLSGVKSSKAKTTKHVTKKSKTVAKNKKHSGRTVAKAHAKKGRSVASTSKNKKHGKTLAKRGGSKPANHLQ